uniref:LIM and SH3 domain protein 1 n=1 Tax=Ailuropoda melanoleuca TaxID=9646 RepID=A0A7N5J8G2_AILME
MNPNCARCGKIVYPTEKVNCLDKFWHKACFHCETCKMTLNMKNYKGYEKTPYCNAHYPKQSFTMVADTPENLRLKQQSELQSQVRYKEEFEKNKGKGFSVVADTPELQRIKKTQDQISNIKYHEEFEKSRMGSSGGEGMEPERRDAQEQPPHHIPTSAPVYQQPQQQQVAQSYGGCKEPAAPVSIPRSAPGGGGAWSFCPTLSTCSSGCGCGGEPSGQLRMKVTGRDSCFVDAPVDICFWSLFRLPVCSPTRGLLSAATVLLPSRPLPEPSGYG